MARKSKKEIKGTQAQPGKELEPVDFPIQVARLRETLTLLEPAVPKKHTLPALKFAHLGGGRAVATDLEVAVSLDLPEAQEELLLPVKGALGFLGGIPGHEVARLTTEGKRVTIAANSTKASLESADPQDYPPIPRVEAEGEGVVDGDALVKALVAVLPYAATEDARPLLAGICLSLGDDLEVAAADGFRLAWEKIPGRLAGEESLIIPARAVSLLRGLWKKGAVSELGQAMDPVAIAQAKRLIRLGWETKKALLEMRFGGITLTAKLIQGTFPKYKQLIPTEGVGVTVQAEDMLRALKQVTGVAEEVSGIVHLGWGGNTLTVSATAVEVGETAVEIPAQTTGPGKTALKLNYLLEYFSSRAGSVTLATESPSAPVTFSHRGTPHVVVMPMHVKD